jgi:hypothetical protein
MIDVVLVWDDGYNQREQDSPTGADIDARVSELDGAIRTLVTIYRGESDLAVGGSAATGLVVYRTHDGSQFSQLLGDNDSEEPVRVVAGGQEGIYPARHVVARKAALVAAQEFCDSDTDAPNLRWE